MIPMAGESRLVDPFPIRLKTPSMSSSSLAPSTVGDSSGRSSAIRNEVRERDEECCIMSGIDEECQVCHLIPRVKGDMVSYLLLNYFISP